MGTQCRDPSSNQCLVWTNNNSFPVQARLRDSSANLRSGFARHRYVWSTNIAGTRWNGGRCKDNSRISQFYTAEKRS
ncbi:unnamed protein product [Protopolystoma xenopodis]|uniref:Uncharacterized protein n=1 Tax=Protopolystoma xenopodis TaxID=117903 RepID=A0A3S4ZZ57_9PLAT|nr:unnamed protein product [Protopolystoma xenopodis]